tara:strand:+ start:338 stop:1060 length:723 start_codon:yes stop_codon:yes gene_type:complete
MGTGTPTSPPSGSDYAVRYQAELPEVMGRKLGLMDTATKLAKGEVPKYQPTIPTQQVADFTPMQQKAFDLVNQGVGAYEQYLNPYQDYVTKGIEDQFAKQENQLNLAAGQRGAFGERNDIALAELARQRADAVGGSLAQGFGQAQNLRMQDISNLMQGGGQQQQQAQTVADAQYRQQLQQMYEPYQRLGFVSDIFQGAPTSASSLAMATTPQANPLAQAVGAGITGLAAYQGFQNLKNTG